DCRYEIQVAIDITVNAAWTRVTIVFGSNEHSTCIMSHHGVLTFYMVALKCRQKRRLLFKLDDSRERRRLAVNILWCSSHVSFEILGFGEDIFLPRLRGGSLTYQLDKPR
ncbi:hypothetical protein CISIN_1g0421812mg, partial [Citrus sinensis]